MTRPAISPLVIALAIVAILGVSIFVYFQLVKGMAPEEPPVQEAAPPPPESPPPPEQAAAPEIEVPLLDASDATVRALAGALSSHPQLAAWLTPEDLVRRFVAAVVNVAHDESPRPNVAFLEPAGDFRVAERDGKLVVAPESYARYDLLTEVFTSLDPAESARLYHGLEPLFDQAYQELGFPAGDFDQPLARAIDRVLATPIPAERPVVRRRVTNYRFADPELEALGPIEKHLLRLGPANARKVQEKLRSLRRVLALDE